MTSCIMYVHYDMRTTTTTITTTTTTTAAGHSNYKIGQIGLNRCKSDQIRYTHYQIWTRCSQLDHGIRSTFSLYWTIRITFLLVFLTQPKAKHVAPLQYANNRNVLNKGDDEVRRWLSLKL